MLYMGTKKKRNLEQEKVKLSGAFMSRGGLHFSKNFNILHYF